MVPTAWRRCMGEEEAEGWPAEEDEGIRRQCRIQHGRGGRRDASPPALDPPTCLRRRGSIARSACGQGRGGGTQVEEESICHRRRRRSRRRRSFTVGICRRRIRRDRDVGGGDRSSMGKTEGEQRRGGCRRIGRVRLLGVGFLFLYWILIPLKWACGVGFWAVNFPVVVR